MECKNPVVLAIDGEKHTDAAVSYAIKFAGASGLPVEAVHVIDPYLKQFHNDIYAQGREEYLEHVEKCLNENAAQAAMKFEKVLRKTKIKYSINILKGDKAEEIIKFAVDKNCKMLITGSREKLKIARFKSSPVWEKLLLLGLGIPLLIVPDCEETK